MEVPENSVETRLAVDDVAQAAKALHDALVAACRASDSGQVQHGGIMLYTAQVCATAAETLNGATRMAKRLAHDANASVFAG